MAMSKDRVRFELSHGLTVKGNVQDAFEKAFGRKIPCGNHWVLDGCNCLDYLPVVCRPSQFARFLIYRNDNGACNGFKELKPELFTPRCGHSPFDVSKGAWSK